jgi:N-acetylmuramoyl-L-alanine amidase CwlA
MQTTGYADRDALITPGDNRPGTKLRFFGSMTVHETDNEHPGATAAMHQRYWDRYGAGRFISSVQFVADSVESVQLMPIDEQAWHAGDDDGNETSVGIEICVNSRSGYRAACQRAAKVIAKVLHAYGKPVIDGVTLRKHGSWPGTTHKQCPLHLNRADWGVSWGQFVGMVTQEYQALTVTNYAALWGSWFPYNAPFGIETAWRPYAATLGKATTDETTDKAGHVWRLFERGAVSYDPKTGKTTVYLPGGKQA